MKEQEARAKHLDSETLVKTEEYNRDEADKKVL